MIEIIDGCLLDAFDRGEVNVLGHVVNCQGVMGSGIALSIKEKYPEVYRAYMESFDDCSKENLLGHVEIINSSFGTDNPIRFVCNMYAQFDYGRNKRHLNYGAISNCLERLSDWTPEHFVVGFPFKMGCDRAGGDFSIVLEMIEFYFKNHQVKIYKLG
jgi:O-acetyl-ADP-ribose deacetylase (regulator of RNase III)